MTQVIASYVSTHTLVTFSTSVGVLRSQRRADTQMGSRAEQWRLFVSEPNRSDLPPAELNYRTCLLIAGRRGRRAEWGGGVVSGGRPRR